MKVEINPKVERVVTLTMTEPEANALCGALAAVDNHGFTQDRRVPREARDAFYDAYCKLFNALRG